VAISVADIYFTEFNRLFNHYYFRSINEAPNGNGNAGGLRVALAEKDDEWLKKYEPGKLWTKRLQLYANEWSHDALDIVAEVRSQLFHEMGKDPTSLPSKTPCVSPGFIFCPLEL